MAIDISEIELSDEQRQQIAELAERTGRPWRDVVQGALRRIQAGPRRATAAAPQSLYDALRQDDLIGCIAGEPPDLSTNPKHLEGFGADEARSH